jgi:hypothetical protein
VLDGSRTHFGHPIRLVRRYLVLRHHSPRVGTGACPSITRILSYTPFSHRRSRATYSRSRWWRAQILSRFQGNRGALPREGPFSPVHTIPFPAGPPPDTDNALPRPPAAQLLQTPFFKNAKKGSYLVGAILRDLPPLAQRMERRRQPSFQLHSTIDSWDFPTTLIIPSPTQSVFPTSLDRPESIYEQDEKDNVPGERTEQIQIATHGVKSPTTIRTSSPSLSKPSSDAGNPIIALHSESLSTKTSTSAASPTVSAASVSAPVSLNELVSPANQSLWRRIRRSTGYSGHGKEAAQARSTFINNMLHRGEGGREAVP